VTVTVPVGTVTDAVTGQAVPAAGGKISVDLVPCQLRSFRVQ
jgi:hypothetical protein